MNMEDFESPEKKLLSFDAEESLDRDCNISMLLSGIKSHESEVTKISLYSQKNDFSKMVQKISKNYGNSLISHLAKSILDIDHWIIEEKPHLFSGSLNKNPKSIKNSRLLYKVNVLFVDIYEELRNNWTFENVINIRKVA